MLATQSDSAALRIGSALHAAVLEPGTYRYRYATAPDVDRRTKAGKSAYAEWESTLAEGVTILRAAESETVDQIAMAVMDSPIAMEVLEVATYREVSAFSTLHGVPCRSRLDAMTPDSQLVCDIKTTGGLASTKEMEQAVWKYGYGLQMCMYREMLRVNSREPEAMVIIAAEKSAPYGVQVFTLDPEVLDLHIPRLERLLRRWQDTVGSGLYPSWEQGDFTPLGVPDWARRDLVLEAELAAINERTVS